MKNLLLLIFGIMFVSSEAVFDQTNNTGTDSSFNIPTDSSSKKPNMQKLENLLYSEAKALDYIIGLKLSPDKIGQLLAFSDISGNTKSLLILQVSERIKSLEYTDKAKEEKEFLIEVIKNFMEKNPWSAVQYADFFSDQPWACEPIRRAVEKEPCAAFNSPHGFVYLPWAEDFCKAFAKKEPISVFCGLHQILYNEYDGSYSSKDPTWMIKLLEETSLAIAEEHPFYLVQNYSSKFKRQPWASDAVNIAADKDPKAILQTYSFFSDQPWSVEVLKKAVGILGKKHEYYDVLYFAYIYKDYPWAKNIIKIAAENNPLDAINFFGNYAGQPWAKEVYDKAYKRVHYSK
jgi:hypothetical protein